MKRQLFALALSTLLSTSAFAKPGAKIVHEYLVGKYGDAIEGVAVDGGRVVRVDYKSGTPQGTIDQIEAEKALIDATPKEDTGGKEVAAAVANTADDASISDDDYAKLVRINNMKDPAKRDAAWADFKAAHPSAKTDEAVEAKPN